MYKFCTKSSFAASEAVLSTVLRYLLILNSHSVTFVPSKIGGFTPFNKAYFKVELLVVAAPVPAVAGAVGTEVAAVAAAN